MRILVLSGWLLLAAPAAAAAPRFALANDAWNLHFRHHHCGSGDYYMVETMGSGVVLFDYDGDGDADVFFVDGGLLPGYEGEAPVSRLFRNEAGERFVDVTERSGIVVKAYGMGATAGDVDGDGDLDLYVSAFGPNQLFENNGDGTFTDVTAAAGVGDPLFGTSAGFADPDADGDLDLYVVNYVDFALDHNIVCGQNRYGFRSYCHPDVYNGEPDRYYRNRGDGTFEEAARAAGLGNPAGKGLGMVWSDLDVDGRLDLYVANDMTFNFQFMNRGTGVDGQVKFEDKAVFTGTAASDMGAEEASMGVGIGDLDGNGRFDLLLTHLDFQTNALYSNVDPELFVDHRFVWGLAEPSIKKVGFGTVFGDYDHDADLDVVIVNGHIIPELEGQGSGVAYRQPNQIFENLGDGRLRELTSAGLDVVRASRGLAQGDLDLDGDLDLVVSNNNDLAEVYENVTGTGGWLELDVRAAAGNRFAVGAWVEVLAGGKRQIGEVRTATSYLSQSDLTLHFGLGKAAGVDEILVRRAGQGTVRVRHLPRDRRLRLQVSPIDPPRGTVPLP